MLHNEWRKFILFVIPFYYPLSTWASFLFFHHRLFNGLAEYIATMVIHIWLVFFQSSGERLPVKSLECAFGNSKVLCSEIPFHNFHFYSFTAQRWIECFMHEMHSLYSATPYAKANGICSSDSNKCSSITAIFISANNACITLILCVCTIVFHNFVPKCKESGESKPFWTKSWRNYLNEKWLYL